MFLTRYELQVRKLFLLIGKKCGQHPHSQDDLLILWFYYSDRQYGAEMKMSDEEMLLLMTLFVAVIKWNCVIFCIMPNLMFNKI